MTINKSVYLLQIWKTIPWNINVIWIQHLDNLINFLVGGRVHIWAGESKCIWLNRLSGTILSFEYFLLLENPEEKLVSCFRRELCPHHTLVEASKKCSQIDAITWPLHPQGATGPANSGLGIFSKDFLVFQIALEWVFPKMLFCLERLPAPEHAPRCMLSSVEQSWADADAEYAPRCMLSSVEQMPWVQKCLFCIYLGPSSRPPNLESIHY